MTIEASMSLSGMHAKTSGGGMSMETEAELPDDSDCKEAGNVVNACLVIMLLCSGFAGFLFNTKPQGQMAKIGQGVAVFTCVFGLPAEEAVGAPAPAATEEPKAEEPKAEEPNQV
eukprot:CAMPEP_0179007434 /NCGR_PEP_ID=MMETSP0795-20121207/15158_1 /TAXON_ID=88552 /ORGANISM="Amoebophrya sp., Strain Ameob2" /LENGTH=114 /DNA_ID=CAMNT_0020702407 /DNA_START=262 /DNA_END=607 /DNA_ORIENTATION=+